MIDRFVLVPALKVPLVSLQPSTTYTVAKSLSSSPFKHQYQKSHYPSGYCSAESAELSPPEDITFERKKKKTTQQVGSGPNLLWRAQVGTKHQIGSNRSLKLGVLFLAHFGVLGPEIHLPPCCGQSINRRIKPIQNLTTSIFASTQVETGNQTSLRF